MFGLLVNVNGLLSNGYNIVGLSQVHNLISLGGPHAGTTSLPLCGSGIFYKKANAPIKSEVYSDYIQVCSTAGWFPFT
ncbi:putative alpha/Beta hydrolase [Helianthus annuus]|nr:putative alpha/Beta hydrolase [Helianthus annuus]KAJ0838522.1 putative alpha/Beta hydrolase [Helianthus annuus]